MKFNLKVEKDCDLKTFLYEKDFSKKEVSRLLLEKKDIFINGIAYGKDFLLKKGDTVEVSVYDFSNVAVCDKKIDIVYEDEYLLIVIKPKGLAVIPTRFHTEDNLAGRVLNYFVKTKQNAGVHVVNRLDLLTAGLVIFAKSGYVHSLFRKAKIEKKYTCSVNGIFAEKQGVINKKIEKGNSGIKRVISESGKQAITEYKVINEKNGISKLDINLITGRTHQIRVHLSSEGHCLTGDALYGDGKGEFDLTCYYLKFTLPITEKTYEFCIK